MASKVGSASVFVNMRNVLYNTFIRRNTMYVATIITAGYFGTRTLDAICDKIWESHNAGKLWKDVKKTLPPPEED
eukprot:CAMPEP_0182441342 /NCGR_PEP_ID=MMETSP1172-20130603/274_1 /TAXON_ID=708627 /ORGANISM="Timspurckia oligopyrenoides, Strain CCMP3278" /LENGTH=74 /DNA_ID=CAMNT_0024635541 /DNA_START=85 /DNA_END=309 /DNA_ORIENTATION=-